MRRLIGLSLAGIGLLAAAHTAIGGPVLIRNVTESMPLGWYRWSPGPLQRGDVIAFTRDALPADHRDRLPPDLVKTIGAVAGDWICRYRDRLDVAGVSYPLTRPAWAILPDAACTQVPVGALLPIALNPVSYDGRYFGFVAVGAVRRFARLP